MVINQCTLSSLNEECKRLRHNFNQCSSDDFDSNFINSYWDNLTVEPAYATRIDQSEHHGNRLDPFLICHFRTMPSRCPNSIIAIPTPQDVLRIFDFTCSAIIVYLII
ncbi:MAG: hypothetical protein ACHQ1D_02610 [Nitrososphaerales archaeon]